MTEYIYTLTFAYVDGTGNRELDHTIKSPVQHTKASLDTEINFRLDGFDAKMKARCIKVVETISVSKRIR